MKASILKKKSNAANIVNQRIPAAEEEADPVLRAVWYNMIARAESGHYAWIIPREKIIGKSEVPEWTPPTYTLDSDTLDRVMVAIKGLGEGFRIEKADVTYIVFWN